MTEYITKEQALEAVRGKMWPGEIEAAIKAIPAADVAPAVHGHWKFCGEDGHGYGRWRCTYCGNVVSEKAAKYFCPFCGARMNGGENDV